MSSIALRFAFKIKTLGTIWAKEAHISHDTSLNCLLSFIQLRLCSLKILPIPKNSWWKTLPQTLRKDNGIFKSSVVGAMDNFVACSVLTPFARIPSDSYRNSTNKINAFSKRCLLRKTIAWRESVVSSRHFSLWLCLDIDCLEIAWKIHLNSKICFGCVHAHIVFTLYLSQEQNYTLCPIEKL